MDVGDLVSPYGKGVKTDFYLEQKGYFNSTNDYDLTFTLSFPNEGDGIVGFDSNKEEWRFAPEDGYESTIKWQLKRLAKEEEALLRINDFKNRNKDYFLRVRTELDENNKVIKANYLRIETNKSEFFFRGGGGIKLTYRFNPRVNSRSLESGGE